MLREFAEGTQKFASVVKQGNNGFVKDGKKKDKRGLGDADLESG